MSGKLLAHGTVITVDEDRRVIPDGGVLVEDDRIAEIGPGEGLRRAHPNADVIDCRGRVVIPGLINTHTHLFQTLLKGLGDDRVLKDWFTGMTAPSAVELTPDDVHAAARHGCVESLKSGVTTLVDFMYVHPRRHLADAVVRGYEETGIRGIVGRGYMTAGTDVGVPEPLVETVDDAIADARRLIGTHNQADARVKVGLAPCMIWTVDLGTLEATRALADETGALVTMHVSETTFEVDYALEHHGMRDLELLEHVGFLGPDVLAVHCVECTPRDLRILKHRSVKVSHNPCSNLYLASGFAPVPAMLLADIPVGLASDGPASNNNHNMIQVLKHAALSHKGYHRDPTVVTAEKVFEMATIDAARTLGMADEIGSIEVGKKADLAVVRLDNFFVTPLHHPVSALVYSALGNETETVLVDGEVVLLEGAAQMVEEGEVRQRSCEAAEDLAQRSGSVRFRDRPWRSW